MIREFIAMCSPRETQRSRFIDPAEMALNAKLAERKAIRTGYSLAQGRK